MSSAVTYQPGANTRRAPTVAAVPCLSCGTLRWHDAATVAQARFDTAPEVTSPEAAADLLAPVLAGRDREACAVLLLDTKHRLISTDVLTVGSVMNTFMDPRTLLRHALMRDAVAVLPAHNHPSGDPTPSADDRAVFRRLVAAGEMTGIDVLDAMVFAGTSWVSLRRWLGSNPTG